MALADILEQIAHDAEEEVRGILAKAEEEAAAIRREAGKRAAVLRERILADAEAEARREAEALLATARLRARDETLAAKQALIDEALRLVVAGIVALEPELYTRLVARRIVAAARGDERVLVAEADRGRLARLPEAVERARVEAGRAPLSLRFVDEPAPVEHGVVLAGERDTVDLSIEGLIDAERDRLIARLAEALFVAEGDG